MITKETIKARFERDVLTPMGRRKVSLVEMTEIWFGYLDICREVKEINTHQYTTWVLPKEYIDRCEES